MSGLNYNDMAADILTNFAEDTVRNAWDRAKKFFKDISAKEAVKYRKAYEDYLSNTRATYCRIKTIIYRNLPRYIYSFYEEIDLQCENRVISTTDINNIIDTGNKIVITGTGGSGKSLLMRHLFLNTIEKTDNIPVLIELRLFNLDENINLEERIFDYLVTNGFTLDKEYFLYSLRNGAYIFFLDGFDEVNRDLVKLVSMQIRDFSTKYGKNKFLVTSRPIDEFIGWNDFMEMRTMKLNKEQALSLTEKIEFDENIKEIFYRELKNKLYEKYKSFASNPLLLNIMLLTFNNHASIPDNLNDFYEQAFLTLFNMHDATKESYVRDIRTRLGCEEFKNLFSYICFKSYFKDEFEFTEPALRDHIKEAKDKFNINNFIIDEYMEDLTISVCMIVKEGLNFRFSHRSFQEYFAARYTCKLEDETQYRLLTGWINESKSALYDSYFTMLFDMQRDKVNKVVLAPGLQKIESIYNKNGYSMELLNTFFEGINVSYSTDDKTEKPRKSLSLRMRDQYLCRILLLTVSNNRYHFARGDEEANNKAVELLLKRGRKTVSLTEAVEIMGEELLLKAVSWIESQIIFAMDILEECRRRTISKKRKVLNILEEL